MAAGNPKGNIVGEYKSSLAQTVEDGNTGPTRITPYRALHVALYDSLGNEVVLSESKTPVKKTVDFTASQTAQDIWDPTGGTSFVITGWVISFSAAGAFHMFDNSDSAANRVAKYFGATNGGANLSGLRIPASAADNILKYTTGSGAAGSITVYGYEV